MVKHGTDMQLSAKKWPQNWGSSVAAMAFDRRRAPACRLERQTFRCFAMIKDRDFMSLTRRNFWNYAWSLNGASVNGDLISLQSLPEVGIMTVKSFLPAVSCRTKRSGLLFSCAPDSSLFTHPTCAYLSQSIPRSFFALALRTKHPRATRPSLFASLHLTKVQTGHTTPAASAVCLHHAHVLSQASLLLVSVSFCAEAVASE